MNTECKPSLGFEDRRGASVNELSGPRELPITLALNDIDYATSLVTPDDLDEWAVGFSFSEGLIDKASHVDGIHHERLRHGLLLRLQVDHRLSSIAAEQRRVGTSMSSCGRCGSASEALMMLGLRRLPPSPLVSIDRLVRALSVLDDYRAQGIHVALGFDAEGNLVSFGRDIGRHNALDKLIGSALLHGIPMPQLVMLSSRCSLELVQKVVRAGIPALATLAVPSTLAVETARLCALQLFNCHRGHRIEILSGETID